jgi:hypothetical protein
MRSPVKEPPGEDDAAVAKCQKAALKLFATDDGNFQALCPYVFYFVSNLWAGASVRAGNMLLSSWSDKPKAMRL